MAWGHSSTALRCCSPLMDAVSCLRASGGPAVLSDAVTCPASARCPHRPGDEVEARAIARALRLAPSLDSDGSPKPDRPTLLRVSSTKGATGHLLGAAGAVEAVGGSLTSPKRGSQCATLLVLVRATVVGCERGSHFHMGKVPLPTSPSAL
jgi:hypothetical protein